MISIFLIFKISNKNDYSDYNFVTSIPIQDIKTKFYDNDFYLTIVLEDDIIEDYNLSYNEIDFKVNKSIYDKIIINSDYTGITLEVVIPYNHPKNDIGIILKEKYTDYCKIIAITTKDNNLIT